jgi:hypothetical protein
MHEPDFQQLQSELLRVGVAPRHVQRTITELREHLDDLVEAALAHGEDPAIARSLAAQQMGDLQEVAIAIRACPELRTWSFRFPRVAVVLYPLTCLVLLPAMPILAGVAHATQLARWAMCIALGALVTAAMLLILQFSIALG